MAEPVEKGEDNEHSVEGDEYDVEEEEKFQEGSFTS